MSKPDTPKYTVGLVPTGRTKLRWQEHFKVAEDYEKFITSGMFWVYFGEDEDEIAAWYLEQKEKEATQKMALALKAKKEYCTGTRKDNYEASCRLEGINKGNEE